jgi:hypothetical protein
LLAPSTATSTIAARERPEHLSVLGVEERVGRLGGVQLAPLVGDRVST